MAYPFSTENTMVRNRWYMAKMQSGKSIRSVVVF